MSQKLYLNILRAGVYLSLFIVFWVNKNFLFPFITSKQVPFNILMEVLFAVWLTFVVKYPKYKPKLSYITVGLASFFSIMVLSCFTGVDFNLSFWGDVERMLGAFHILHFFILYLIIVTVFRKWSDWRNLYILSIVIAVFVSLKGMGDGVKAYSTIGNTAYVSGYLIFNIFFSVLLFLKDRKSDYKWLYLLPLFVYFPHFTKLNTTGALVGFGFSLIVLTFLYGILSKNKKIKTITLSLFTILILFSYWSITHKDSDFVKNTPFVKNIRQIDLDKRTFQTRLISWKAGIKDLKDHPMLGTGHGNFAVIFDRHFDPTFYNYTRSETYFDRAHNNIIDIASTTGVLGLITYLSIFGAVGFYLISGYRSGKIDIHEFVITSSLLTAYFVQNLAVFDSFVTYMGLMVTLAYIYWMSNRDKVEDEFSADEKVNDKEIYTFVISGGIMLIILVQYNFQPWGMLTKTIEAQKNQKNTEKTLDIYQDALKDDGVLDRDSRTSLIRLFSNQARFSGMSEERKIEVLDYIIEQAEKNVAYNKGDSMNQMVLAQILNMASIQVRGNQSKFAYYSDRALEAINASIAASPRRVPIYYQKAQIQMTRAKNEEALDTLRYAYSLNTDYWDSACHLGKTLFQFDQGKLVEVDQKEAWKYMDECVGSKGGAKLLSSPDYVVSLRSHYAEQNDLLRVMKLQEQLTKLTPKQSKNFVDLAFMYESDGEDEKFIKTIGAIKKLNLNLESHAQEFVDSALEYKKQGEKARALKMVEIAIILDQSLETQAKEFIDSLK